MELSNELVQSIVATQDELIRRLQTELAKLQIDHEIILVDRKLLQETHATESEARSTRIIELKNTVSGQYIQID